MQVKNNEEEDAKHAEAVRRIMKAMGRRNRVRARGGRGFPAMMTLAVVAVLGTVLWYSYPKEHEYQEINSVPLIRADAGPIKAVPNDPGGMDIPYRDSTVFDTIRSARNEDGEGGEVENLLSDSEAPMTRDQMFAGVNTALEDEGTQDAIEIGNAADVVVATKSDVETGGNVGADKVAKIEKPVVETKDSLTNDFTSVAVAAPVPVKKPDGVANHMARTEPAAGSTVITAAGGYLVQLASVRSREDAQRVWANLQREFPNELGGLKLNVDVADLGTRGVYYRVQGGAVTEARARAICSVIDMKKSGGCFVVRNR